MAVALTLEYLFLWFLLYAFIGWVYESVLVSVSGTSMGQPWFP